jgi:hypothetical protein
MRTAEMVAEQQKGLPHSTVGVVLTATKMDGLIQPTHGWPALEGEVMLGQWIQPNGTTLMEMDVGTILAVRPPTFAPIKRAPQLDHLRVATDGVVPTRTATDGLT